MIVAGDQDVTFPGAKLSARAKELVPGFAGSELIENCKHSPPTTDELRGWLAGKLASSRTSGHRRSCQARTVGVAFAA